MKTAIISSNLFEWLTPPAVQAGRGKAVRRGNGLRSGSESEVMPAVRPNGGVGHSAYQSLTDFPDEASISSLTMITAMKFVRR